MFSKAFKIFSLYSFDIKVDPSWVIIAALVTWSLSKQYFPQVLPNASDTTYFAMALIGMLGLFASLLLHELAHSVVARRRGVPIKSITLFIFGGMAELGTEPATANDEFWIALAGPIMSLCLALGFWVFAQTAWFFTTAMSLVEVLSYLALINLVLALFNLVPAFPLDGGRILRAYLWHRNGDALSATKTAAKSGAIFAYVMMILGVLTLFQGAIVTGMWELMIGGFVLIAARSSYTSQLAKIVFESKEVHSLATVDPITVSPQMILSEFVNQIILRQGVSFAPVVEGKVLLGYIDKSVLSGIDRENWGNTRIGDVFVGLEKDVMLAPELPVSDLLTIIAETGRRKFMVVSDHKLLGVITLSDLTRHLSLADQTV